MVREAEENSESDKQLKARVEAKNQLESYLYGLRSSLEDSLKDKIAAEDKETLSAAVKDGLAWLEEHPSDEASSYEDKRKELEAIANPIISKAYSAASPPSGADGSGPGSSSSDGIDPSSSSSGPTVEEVD